MAKWPEKAVETLVRGVRDELQGDFEKILIRPAGPDTVAVQAFPVGVRDPEFMYCRIAEQDAGRSGRTGGA